MSAGGHGSGPKGGGRRPKKHEEEEHENHERWLVSYADMLTLLFVLFVVLFAISQVDVQKFEALKASFGSGPATIIDGGDGPLDQSGVSPAPASALTSISPPRASGSVSAEALAEAERLRRDRDRRAAQREVAALEETARRLQAELRERGLQDDVRTRIDERGLVVSIVTDKVIFPAHRAELTAEGVEVIAAVAPALRTLPNSVLVEGHTNQAPVRPRYYPSDWELSSARASAVVRALVGRHGFDPQRISAAGRADQHPLIDPADPRALELNRRVEVVVLSDLGTRARALLAEAAGAAPSAAR